MQHRLNGAYAWVGVFATGGGLSGATGMNFGADGDLFFTSINTDNVLRYDGTTGAFEGAFVASGAGGLNAPFNLEFGGDGKLYVLGSGHVLRFDATTGAFLDNFINVPSNGGTFLGFVIPEPAMFGMVPIGVSMLRRKRPERAGF